MTVFDLRNILFFHMRHFIPITAGPYNSGFRTTARCSACGRLLKSFWILSYTDARPRRETRFCNEEVARSFHSRKETLRCAR
ncbi:MAG: hypothetical protein D6812_02895 [Deltaproteobacteria bacterium]|nr:MAG: hypothetical protein D6812_02895 [Deltaproteobacteria bacterium]